MKILNHVRLRLLESLAEDIGREDVTTKLLVPKELNGEAIIVAKANGILCGGEIAKEVFRLVDPKLKVDQKILDGSSFSKGKKIFHISGKVASILKAERVALNFLSRLSGIATVTNQYVKKIKGTRAHIYDTRKTTPLWRDLEKYAVRTGGGENHRFGLWDEVLVKDNHWVVLKQLSNSFPLYGGRLGWGFHPPTPHLNPPPQAPRAGQGGRKIKHLGRADFFAPLTMKKNKIPIEIEVASLKELTFLLEGSFVPDRILLDNFSVPGLRKAVKLVRKQRKRISLEASGGISLENVHQIAKTGVNRISVGVLTHSAPSLDFSLTVSKVT